MEFLKLKQALQSNFEILTQDIEHLFTTCVDGEELWETYLDAFPEGTNEIFRKRREYDCSCCRQFIKNIGGVVRLKGGKITTIWDFKVEEPNFQIVVDKMNKYVLEHPINGVYITHQSYVGTDRNRELLEDDTVRVWNHFYLDLPKKLVSTLNLSEGQLNNKYNSNRDVFYNSLDKISLDALDTVLELISSNTLYKGKEWESQLKNFRKYKLSFEKAEDKQLFSWEYSIEADTVLSRIKNHSIGKLLLDISEGIELERAVKSYENIVAGANYKRPNAIYTQKTMNALKEKIVANGYEDSLYRRYANIDDINISNILFANKDSAKVVGNVFDEMIENIGVEPKKFNGVQEIGIIDFIDKVLPKVTEVEALFENKHISNLVSLTAPKVKGSKSMFKWDNAFGWAYRGNITDSAMKERVKQAGGDVEGVLRFSIQWNDLNTWNKDDLDAHCVEPNQNSIYFSNMKNPKTTAELDTDVRHPTKGEPAVENITWQDKDKMLKGDYIMKVHNYANRGGIDGFCAEIEFDGNIYEFEYRKPIGNSKFIDVAVVHFDGVNFTLKPILDCTSAVREEWGVKTNQFIPVSLIMYSPNYWDQQIGHRHYMFMLKNCINDELPNAFYNEFFKQEFHEDRKALEALGNRIKIEDTNDQLSGIGFSETKRNSLIVKVKGKIERVIKILF